MGSFVTASDGVRISFEVSGEGAPVVLVHGFAASRAITWANTGWYTSLARHRHRVVALDCRGHGGSDKPHEPAAYDEGRMAADILAVMDSLDIPSADLIGYSMGGYLAIRLMSDAPARLRRVVLGGVGGTYFDYWTERAGRVAQALLAPDGDAITDPLGREFRTFAERAGGDLDALAACMRRPRHIFTPGELARLPHPVLVVCGEVDTISGPPEPLAACFANGRSLTVPRRNHHSTVGDRVYKDGAAAFLEE